MLDNVSDKVFDQLVNYRLKIAEYRDHSNRIEDLEPFVSSLSKMENVERKNKLARALYELGLAIPRINAQFITIESETLFSNMMNQLRAIINSLQPQPAQGQQPQAQD